jgi:hypothetical protein
MSLTKYVEQSLTRLFVNGSNVLTVGGDDTACHLVLLDMQKPVNGAWVLSGTDRLEASIQGDEATFCMFIGVRKAVVKLVKEGGVWSVYVPPAPQEDN